MRKYFPAPPGKLSGATPPRTAFHTCPERAPKDSDNNTGEEYEENQEAGDHAFDAMLSDHSLKACPRYFRGNFAIVQSPYACSDRPAPSDIDKPTSAQPRWLPRHLSKRMSWFPAFLRGPNCSISRPTPAWVDCPN